jgi:acetyl esterase
MADFPEMTAEDRLNGAVGRSLHKLPAPVKRRLAGAPVVRDGLTLDLDLQLLLAARRLSREPEIHELPIDEARVSYRRQFGALTPAPERVYDVSDLTLPGPAGDIPARLYSPPPGAGPLPLLVHYHGGGHVTGDPDTCDYVSRRVVHRAGAIVLSVDYRMGPEHPMPAPNADARASYLWAREHAEELGADPERIAVGGDSAGGNLGTVVCLDCRDAGDPLPAFQWLVYPVTDLSRRSASRDLLGDAFLLTDPVIEWYNGHFLSGGDPADLHASPLLAPDLSGLPPAYVATAGFDPLRDEGEAYARRLEEAGVPTTLRRFDDLIHGFANLTAASPAARAAVDETIDALRAGLAPRRANPSDDA